MDCILHISGNEITNRAAIAKFFKGLKDGKYILSAKLINKRSISQNRYYFGVCVAMIKDRLIELGNDVTSEDVHAFLKDRFNSKELFTKDGTVIGTVGASTAGLNKGEFELYLDKVKQFGSDPLSIFIPDPSAPMPMFNNYEENNEITVID